MKKTVSSLLLASALLLGTAAPVVANAATAATAGTGTTSNSITFKKPDTSTTPVDPDKPGTEVPTDPGDNGGTEPSGDLTFLYVSPSMNFGEQSISTDKTNYDTPTVTSRDFTTSDKSAVNKNLVTEVSDTRGTNAGWTVSITADPMVSGSNTLTGATLQIDGSSATINNSAVAKDEGVTGADTGALATDGKTPATIYSAEVGSGLLATTFQVDPANIKLANVPANVKAGTYTGDINWTLSDTPGA